MVGYLRYNLRGAGGGGGGTSTLPVNLTVQNTSGSTSTTPEVRFAHVFKQGDVPSTKKLVITQGGVSVPYTASKRSTWADGSLRVTELFCKLPSNITGSSNTTLVIDQVTGSFDDALPNGKTTANIVTDITTNFDSIGVELSSLTNSSGSTEGSGTWVADSNTAFGLSTTHGGYRVRATGPTACEFIVWMKLKDGATEHGGLWAQWYITAFLNTTTGAVTKLSWRAWVNQGRRDVANDKYRCQIKVKLGSTTVRSWGFSGDGRAGNFTVSTVTDEAAYTGNGFLRGELVRLTTTGTLPAPLQINTDYWVRPGSDANHFTFHIDQAGAGYGSIIDLTTTGSGTHTVTGYVHHCFAQRQCLARSDGLWDWHAGNSGALGGEPTVHCVHDIAYYQAAKMVPPADLSINLAAATETTTSTYSPGTFGRMVTSYNDGGSSSSYGAPWNDWCLRATRYRTDRTGYVQTSRAHALLKGSSSCHYIRDDSTFRIPVVNNGSDGAGTTYSGLGAVLKNSYTFRPGGVGAHSTDWIEPTSTNTNSWTAYNYTHHFMGPFTTYIFEGGSDMIELLYSDANMAMAFRYSETEETYVNGVSGTMTLDRKYSIGGNSYYSCLPGREPRADAWKINLLVDAVTAGADGDAEKLYLSDCLTGTLAVLNGFINTLGTSSWRAVGGWDLGETQQSGANVTNVNSSEVTTLFYQDYIGMAWSFAYMRLPSTNLANGANHVLLLLRNLWVVAPCASYGNTYNIRVKLAAGANATPDARLHVDPTDLGILDSGIDGVIWNSDGTVVPLPNSNFAPIQIQQGDKIYLSTTNDVSVGFYDGPPSAYASQGGANTSGVFGTYFARSVTTGLNNSGDQANNFKLATTNSDGTIIGSVTPSFATTTLSGAINSSTTTIPLNASLTFTSGLAMIRIGTELMKVTGGSGTTSLTVTRGAYGSTAASHSSGDTVEGLKTALYWSNVTQRSSGCAVNVYRHYPGAAGASAFGYLTMARAALGYGYVAGLIARTGYDNASAYFQNESGPPGSSTTGPQGFIDSNTLMHTINVGLA